MISTSISGRVAAIIVIGAMFGCGANSREAPAAIARDTLVGGTIIAGGMIATGGGSWRQVTLLLVPEADAYRVRAIGENLPYQTVDTIRADGLYIQNIWNPEALIQAGKDDWLVIREGPSLANPIHFFVGHQNAAVIRRLATRENYPEGAADHRVGCYALELGAWDNPEYGTAASRGMIPDALRLNWQYWWYPGREKYLIATTPDGSLPSERVTVPIWTLRGDTVQVVFGHGFGGVVMRLTEADDGLRGSMVASGDTHPGPRAEREVRLHRIQCPELGA